MAMPISVQSSDELSSLVTVVTNPTAIERPVLAYFLDYWRAKKGEARLPLYASFNPREVGSMLSFVTVADALPGYDDFRYRVIATRAEEYFSGSSTGKTVLKSHAESESVFGPFVVSLYRKACQECVPVLAKGPALVSSRRCFADFASLFLPFSSDGKHADRVLNAFAFDSDRVVIPRMPTPANPGEIARERGEALRH